MADARELQSIVERITEEVVSRHAAKLREELSGTLLEEVQAAIAEGTPPSPPSTKEEEQAPGTGPTDLLFAAVATLQDTTVQAEILRSLLDGASKFASRCALFVVRGTNLNGWQAMGFDNPDGVKGATVNGAQGLPARVLQDKVPAAAAAAEFDSEFIARHGNPATGNAWVLPLVVKEKAAAVLYADGGRAADGVLDASALQLLVRTAATWIELCGLRKSGVTAAPESAADMGRAPEMAAAASLPRAGVGAVTAEPPVEETSEDGSRVREIAFPQAAAAPPMPAANPAPLEPMPPPPPPAPFEAEPAAAGQRTAAPQPAQAPAPSPATAAAAPAVPSGLSPEEEEVHKKAKRFAKLLVDEIKLYNQAKVTEGRTNRDLYKRLQEDIEKSRSTYEKRFGNTAAASANYFNGELIRILAENDVSLLGAEFPR